MGPSGSVWWVNADLDVLCNDPETFVNGNCHENSPKFPVHGTLRSRKYSKKSKTIPEEKSWGNFWLAMFSTYMTRVADLGFILMVISGLLLILFGLMVITSLPMAITYITRLLPMRNRLTL